MTSLVFCLQLFNKEYVGKLFIDNGCKLSQGVELNGYSSLITTSYLCTCMYVTVCLSGSCKSWIIKSMAMEFGECDFYGQFQPGTFLLSVVFQSDYGHLETLLICLYELWLCLLMLETSEGFYEEATMMPFGLFNFRFILSGEFALKE